MMAPTSLNEASLEFLIMSGMTGVTVEELRGAGSRIGELTAFRAVPVRVEGSVMKDDADVG